ncbi:aminodeoxychorismate lyase [Compostimonas suwonensis]|uniref:4-amino-4-deoxychorismate lyase n=1 Tax=Compostimonas suwonensis TaxID=1048394 RepID=A0A2M9BU20_9MICO|nr:aminodeoxychorismate lyase [Compostimonas suwonensis]PJJ61449.1 4-amino-4-deoxychorismate lyase [Compostimonas suwonensis]
MSHATLFLVTRPVSVEGVLDDAQRAAPDFLPADPAEPQLSVLDLGVSRGDGCFESISVVRGHAQALESHLERFAASARRLDLPEPDLDVWRAAVHAVIQAHVPVPELFVKMMLTRGIEGANAPTGWVYAETAPDFREARTTGIRVVTLDRGYRHDVNRTSPWLLQGAKTLSYAVNRAAIREAHRRGANDVIFVSSDGIVLEGPTSNLILLDGGRVRTPQTDLGILAGTTQASAFEFFESRGLRTEYATISADELERADAAWLVSSVRQAAPINAIDDRELLVDGPLTEGLNEYLLARQE